MMRISYKPSLFLALFTLLFTLMFFSVPGYSANIDESWYGINYFPQNHQFYNMFYDWYTLDRQTGKLVYQIVENDLAMLSLCGFDFLHLYIWEEAWFQRGFKSLGSDPRDSDNDQWNALNEFVVLADKYGFKVGVHFANKTVIDKLQSGITKEEAVKLGEDYYDWASIFIKELSRHENIVLWGFIYGFSPAPLAGGEENGWNAFFKSGYSKFDRLISSLRPKNPALLGINLAIKVIPFKFGIRTRYIWNTFELQRQAKVLTDMGLREPDVFMLQLYNHNDVDLKYALKDLTSGPLVREGISLDPKKIFVVEFGASSSLANPPYGNNIFGVGDSFSPSYDLNGHRSWLLRTLRAFNSFGINKMAYWTLYDAPDFWSGPPFNKTKDDPDFAWQSHLGLMPYGKNLKPKPAFWDISRFYKLKKADDARRRIR
ncbi:MAG: hypothetical protein Q8Q06_02640 [bacterium]|nr:hypothetical protein [bacterium]